MSAQVNVSHNNELQPAPYADATVEVAGLKLHVQDYGTAGKPAMLCVHGGAAHAHWFDFVAAGFTANYHVRAVDLRGHGDSGWDTSVTPDYSYQRYAADLHELTDKLDLRDFILIGHSMGGVVSTVYAGTYPGRAKAFILVDSTVAMPPERIADMQARGSREGRSYADRDELVAHYKVRPGGSTADPRIIRHLAMNSGRRFDDGRWRYKFDRNVYATRERMDSYPFWDNIKIPAMLMKGGRSERITPEVIAGVKARAPQVEIAEVPNADHHVTLDNPQGFIEALKQRVTTS
jgi:pimeloyl-ACP methyl ester carboxylesterase